MSGASEFGLILRDRPYHDAVLDLDRSKGVPPTEVLNQYRFLRFCGLLFEQISCCTLTGMATFTQANEKRTP